MHAQANRAGVASGIYKMVSVLGGARLKADAF